MKVIIVCRLRHPDVIKKKILNRIPKLEKEIHCTKFYEEAHEWVNLFSKNNEEILIIGGNPIRTTEPMISIGFDDFIKPLKAINPKIKVASFCSIKPDSNFIDKHFEKEGSGDHDCEDIINILYYFKVIKEPNKDFFKKILELIFYNKKK